MSTTVQRSRLSAPRSGVVQMPKTPALTLAEAKARDEQKRLLRKSIQRGYLPETLDVTRTSRSSMNRGRPVETRRSQQRQQTNSLLENTALLRAMQNQGRPVQTETDKRKVELLRIPSISTPRPTPHVLPSMTSVAASVRASQSRQNQRNRQVTFATEVPLNRIQDKRSEIKMPTFNTPSVAALIRAAQQRRNLARPRVLPIQIEDEEEEEAEEESSASESVPVPQTESVAAQVSTLVSSSPTYFARPVYNADVLERTDSKITLGLKNSVGRIDKTIVDPFKRLEGQVAIPVDPFGGLAAEGTTQITAQLLPETRDSKHTLMAQITEIPIQAKDTEIGVALASGGSAWIHGLIDPSGGVFTGHIISQFQPERALKLPEGQILLPNERAQDVEAEKLIQASEEAPVQLPKRSRGKTAALIGGVLVALAAQYSLQHAVTTNHVAALLGAQTSTAVQQVQHQVAEQVIQKTQEGMAKTQMVPEREVLDKMVLRETMSALEGKVAQNTIESLKTDQKETDEHVLTMLGQDVLGQIPKIVQEQASEQGLVSLASALATTALDTITTVESNAVSTLHDLVTNSLPEMTPVLFSPESENPFAQNEQEPESVQDMSRTGLFNHLREVETPLVSAIVQEAQAGLEAKANSLLVPTRPRYQEPTMSRIPTFMNMEPESASQSVLDIKSNTRSKYQEPTMSRIPTFMNVEPEPASQSVLDIKSNTRSKYQEPTTSRALSFMNLVPAAAATGVAALQFQNVQQTVQEQQQKPEQKKETKQEKTVYQRSLLSRAANAVTGSTILKVFGKVVPGASKVVSGSQYINWGKFIAKSVGSAYLMHQLVTQPGSFMQTLADYPFGWIEEIPSPDQAVKSLLDNLRRPSSVQVEELGSFSLSQEAKDAAIKLVTSGRATLENVINVVVGKWWSRDTELELAAEGYTAQERTEARNIKMIELAIVLFGAGIILFLKETYGERRVQEAMVSITRSNAFLEPTGHGTFYEPESSSSSSSSSVSLSVPLEQEEDALARGLQTLALDQETDISLPAPPAPGGNGRIPGMLLRAQPYRPEKQLYLPETFGTSIKRKRNILEPSLKRKDQNQGWGNVYARNSEREAPKQARSGNL